MGWGGGGGVRGVNTVMIKNIFFLHLIYISLSNDMSRNLNSLDEKQIKSDNSVSKIEGGGGWGCDHHVIV